MATDPQERAQHHIDVTRRRLVSNGDWNVNDWKDAARALADDAAALSAELVEARRERDDAQARLARLEEAARKYVRDDWAAWNNIDGNAWPELRAALSGGVTTETRDGERCDACDKPITHYDADGQWCEEHKAVWNDPQWSKPVGVQPEEPTCACRNFGPYEYREVAPGCRIHGRAAVSGEAGNG